ncbi:MAG TPA: hypothetical protein VF319_11860 [Caldimonas sp.]
MKTIQRTSLVLRRIALAGLGAASLWTAAAAHAAIAPSTAAGLGDLQAAVRTPAPADALPLGNAPFVVAPAEPQALPRPILVAPTCPTCRRGQGATGTLGTEHASEPKALPAPFLVAPSCARTGCMHTDTRVVAGGDPTTVRDSRRPPLRG